MTDRHHAESIGPYGSLIDHHLGHRVRARAADDRPSGSVTIREVTVAELPALLDDWHRLVEMAAEPNIFAEPEVLLPALAMAASEVTVLVAEAPRRDNPQTNILCGLLPLSRPSHVPAVASPVTAWRHQHAYLGNPLIRLDALDETIGALLDYLAGHASLIRFSKLPVGGPVQDGLVRVARERSLPSGVWDQYSRALFVRAASAEEYVQRAVAPKRLKKLRRLHRRLAEEGEVRLEAQSDALDLDEWLDSFFVLEAAGWKGQTRTALGCSPADIDFARTVCRNLDEHQRLMRTTLLLDDSPIAMQIGFVRGEQAWAFKIAHDPWKGKYSPGSLLDLLLAEALHDTDIAWMDQCADAGHPTVDGIWDGRIPMQSLWIGTTSRLGQVARMAGPIQGLHDGVRRSRPFPSTSEPPIMRVDPQLHSLDEPFLVEHDLSDHPLFELDRLAELVDLLPDNRLEYNRGDVDIVQNPDTIPMTGMTAAETIRNIETSESWLLLRNVEADPEYRSLLDRAVDEFCARIGPAAANDLRREGFIFISSPNAITPYHIDPEHNVLLQIRGSKTMSIYDTSGQGEVHTIELERFFAGGHCNLETEPPESRQEFELVGGLGLSVPVAAPHVVHNGPEVSISFSMTFRSPYSQHTARRHRINKTLRSRGLPTIDAGHPVDRLLGPTSKAVDRAKRLR